MKRREFFKAGLVGATLPVLTFGNSKLKRNQKSPVIITTHNFPKANAAAIEVLKKYGSSMDAAEAGCRAIEADKNNSNAGIGSLPDEDGRVTLDSCVMDSSGNCGSVAFLQNIAHPVSVARKVMEDTKHVMLVGRGAKSLQYQRVLSTLTYLPKRVGTLGWSGKRPEKK